MKGRQSRRNRMDLIQIISPLRDLGWQRAARGSQRRAATGRERWHPCLSRFPPRLPEEEPCTFWRLLLPPGRAQLCSPLSQPLLSPKHIELCWKQSMFSALSGPSGKWLQWKRARELCRTLNPSSSTCPPSFPVLLPSRQLPPH